MCLPKLALLQATGRVGAKIIHSQRFPDCKGITHSFLVYMVLFRSLTCEPKPAFVTGLSMASYRYPHESLGYCDVKGKQGFIITCSALVIPKAHIYCTLILASAFPLMYFGIHM